MEINFSSGTPVSKKILIVVPALNEEDSIGEVIQKVRTMYPHVLVYDDGSTDNTAAIAENNGAIVIRNSRNRGYGRALNTLFQQAIVMDVDVVVTIDSDGQHDPNQIPLLIQPLLENKADIVIGSRFLTNDDKINVPKYRRLGIKTITRFAQVGCFNKITDATSGFRAYTIDSLKRIHLTENGMAIATEILLKADQCDLRIIEVPITTRRYDIKDDATHNPFKLGWSVISHVIRFLSFKHPLLFYGVPGLILLVVSSLFIYNALDLFSNTRYISTNMILISLGFAIMGILLLATSAIIYTIIALFKGQIRNLR